MDSLVVYNLKYEKICELLDNKLYRAYGLVEDFCCTEISGLSFNIPLANPKSEHIINENLVCLNDEFYRIKNPQVVYDSDGKSYLNVTCSHLSDTLRDNTITMEETMPVDAITLMKRALQYRYTPAGVEMLGSAKNMRDKFLKNYTDALRKAERLKVAAELDNATEDEIAKYEAAELNAKNAKKAYLDAVNWLASRTIEADKTSTPTLGWKVGQITINGSTKRGLESVEDSIFNILLNIAEKYDGLLKFNSKTKTIDLVKANNSESPALELSLSKNLKGLTINYDTSELVTKLYCFGNQTEEGVDLNLMKVNGGKAYIENYQYFNSIGYSQSDIDANPELFVKTSVWRDTNYYEAADLLADGIEKLSRMSLPNISISVSALDFSEISDDAEKVNLKIGDSVKVIDEDNGLSYTCFVTKRTINYDERHIYNLELANKIVYSTTLAKLFKRSAKTENSITEKGLIPSWKIDDLTNIFIKSDMLPFYVAVENYPTEMKEGLLYLKYVPE